MYERIKKLAKERRITINSLESELGFSRGSLSKIDKITMYGADGTSNLVSNITQTISKISDGVQDSTGLDLKSVITGYLGNGMLNNLKNKSIDDKKEK